MQRTCAAMSVTLAIAGAAATTAADRSAAAGLGEGQLRLEQAIGIASSYNPGMISARAEVRAAQGRLVTARTYPYNPEIAIEAADRSAAGAGTTDRSLSISQELEIGGRRRKRTAAAGADLEAALARLERRRREVVAAVSRAFADDWRAREQMEIADADLELTIEVLSFEERRLEAGASTQISVNVARAAAGQARSRLYQSEADWVSARARLAEIIGRSADDPLDLLPPLAPPPLPAVDLSDLIDRALESRHDLAALRNDLEAARRRVGVQRAMARPNLRVEAFSRREEDFRINGGSLSIALPIFDHNRGGILQAEAAVSSGAAELLRAELATTREVAAALARYDAATMAAQDLRDEVVGSLEDSVDLLRRALDAGKVSTTEVLLLRRELFQARRLAVEASSEAVVARAELELAIGAPLATLVEPEP